MHGVSKAPTSLVNGWSIKQSFHTRCHFISRTPHSGESPGADRNRSPNQNPPADASGGGHGRGQGRCQGAPRRPFTALCQERAYMMPSMNEGGKGSDYGSSEAGSYEHEHEEELEHHHRVHHQEHPGGVHCDGDDDIKAVGEGYLRG
ncbi:hypothetical protein VPH35_054880 [Triticum aestivum]